MLKRHAASAALAVALLAAGILLLSYASGLTWFQDSWEFLMHRRAFTANALLEPHNEHIVLFPVLIFQALLHLFGIGSMMPESVVLTFLLLATATLLFVYVRRRLGPWPAAIAALLLLFLGPAWQDLLWPFQIGFVGSSLFGVGMLLALERGDRGGDRLACTCLTLSLGFSSLGLPFALGALVDVLQRRRALGLRRLYVVLVPAALYGVWYLGWGHDAESHLSAHNVLASPGYLVEGFAASLDSLLALATIFGEAVGRSKWGLPLLIVLVLALAYRVFRGWRPSPRIWPALAAALAFWLLAGANTIPGREAYSSRYLYVGALFVLLLGADLLRDLRIRSWGVALAGALALAVVGFNLTPLREGRDFFRDQSVLTRADLSAIEIAERTVDPDFTLPPEIAGTPFLNEIAAGEYLQAVAEGGSPAYSPAELARAPEAGRTQADVVLANALPLEIENEAAPPASPGRCRTVPGDGVAPLALRPGTVNTELGRAAGTIALRRFAVAAWPLADEGVPGGSTTRLTIPADASARPWRLRVRAPGGATVCRSW